MENINRTKISFKSDTVECIGYLYLPINTKESLPCVVMGSGFGGTQDTPAILFNARKFTEAGFAVLTFDYRTFGESHGEPRQIVSIKGQLEDFQAAIQFIRNHQTINSDRIALWGTSLGGGHVVSVAARDPRIAAVVAQIPFNGFPKFKVRSSEMTRKLFMAMFKDMFRGWLGRSPYYIKSVGNIGELAVMATAEAQKTIDEMDSKHWRNEVAPRIFLEMMKYKPSDTASEIKMPLLVCIAEHDRETVGELAMEIVEAAPYGEQKSYPVGHFDFYRPDIREQVSTDQVNFLSKHLLDTKAII